MLAEDGGPNAMFFTVLFCDEPMALEFLQDEFKFHTIFKYFTVRGRIIEYMYGR